MGCDRRQAATLPGSVSWLSEEMKKFPEEFFLFSTKIGSLEFEDQGPRAIRDLDSPLGMETV